MLCSFNSHAQNVRQDKAGNFIAIPKPSQQAKPTGKTYTDTNGEKSPVYITGTGKYFVERTSKKTGKKYRYYLKA